MGIRFRCHHCEHELHVKDFQGGKRGRCPECQGKFRIPSEDAEHSLPVQESELSGVGADHGSLAGANQLARAATGIQGSAQATTARSTPAIEQAASTHRKTHTKPAKPSSGEPAKPSSGEPAKPSSGEPTKPTSTTKLVASGPSRSDAASGSGDIDSSIQVAEADAISQGTEMRMLPRSVTDFPASIWHVRPASGGQYGPAPAEIFTQWLIEGRVDQQAWVWRDDWPDWQAAHSVFAEFYQPAAEAKPKPAPVSPPLSVPPVAPHNPATLASTADGANARRDRRRRQRQRNIIIVAVLVVLFLGLLAALAVVLMNQGN